MNSTFTISLDLELHWGSISRISAGAYQENLEGTRAAISQTLKLFEAYEIHATWATVGFLFFDNKSELLDQAPLKKPKYINEKYNTYQYLNKIGEDEQSAPFYFGKSIIEEVKRYPFQEIATHTFSHYFCLEEGQDIEAFQADLEAAIQMANQKGIPIESIIFPRNQYSILALKVCENLGIRVFRGNPKHFIYQPRKREEESDKIRLVRFLDAYFNLTGYQVGEIHHENKILNVPASRFLRPIDQRLKIFENIRLRRIKKEMTVAAQQGKLYHLWWHPHNFGRNTKENIEFLEKILIHFQKLKHRYGMESWNMKEIAEIQSELISS